MKTFLIYFFLGVIFFFIALHFFPNLVVYLQISPPQKIGVVGSYTTDILPTYIQNYISLGLTKIDEGGNENPSASESWDTENNGKTYVFHLRKDLTFQDGQKFKSSNINYQFKEAKTVVIDPYTIRFDLAEAFAPFPSIVARPIFKRGLIGLGAYKVQGIEKNGSFIESFMLQNSKNTSDRILFRFYPTEAAVKTAFSLGEVDTIDLLDASGFEHLPNVTIEKKTAAGKIMAVLYNTKDPILSKTTRQALSYGLPDDFHGQKEANSPLSFTSWAYKEQADKFKHNVDSAKRLQAGSLTLTLTTPTRFYSLSKEIQNAWREIGVETNIQVVDTIPSDFQVLLDLINLPSDPDQYNFWHSSQPMNITSYDNKRIDKLLEDGRTTVEKDKRIQIYSDFQKYLVDDAPASFLYYPDVYTVKRK